MGSAALARQRNGEVTVFKNPSSSGNTEVVAAAGSGLMIRVVSMALVSADFNNIKFQSATTDITALFALATNGGMILPPKPEGWFQTAANEALNINLSAASAVGVQIQYVITRI